MIKIEETETYGWKAAIRGMRNPKNSWDKSDSDYRIILCAKCDDCKSFKNNQWEDCDNCSISKACNSHKGFMVGPNDLDLMRRLCAAGTDHRKFMRMLVVYCDITAPLYWWKEFDTYKVGTVANSCSTMHKIHDKEFTLDDFSYDHLIENPEPDEVTLAPEKQYEDYADDAKYLNFNYYTVTIYPKDLLEIIIEGLNKYRNKYLETKNKEYWWQMIQLLPSSYNQKRTVMLNYEVLTNMYNSRRNHKLDEWHDFCDWIKTLPYSELITGEEDLKNNCVGSCDVEFVKDPVKVTVKYDGQTYDVINKYESKSVRSFDLRETVNDTDPVNHPNHYEMVGPFESFDIIVESLGIDGARQFCQGNIIKYQTRYKEKNGEEDLKKRHWYSRMDQMLAKCKTIKDYYKLKESDF